MRSANREPPENVTARRRISSRVPEETDMGFLCFPVSIDGWCRS